MGFQVKTAGKQSWEIHDETGLRFRVSLSIESPGSWLASWRTDVTDVEGSSVPVAESCRMEEYPGNKAMFKGLLSALKRLEKASQGFIKLGKEDRRGARKGKYEFALRGMGLYSGQGLGTAEALEWEAACVRERAAIPMIPGATRFDPNSRARVWLVFAPEHIGRSFTSDCWSVVKGTKLVPTRNQHSEGNVAPWTHGECFLLADATPVAALDLDSSSGQEIDMIFPGLPVFGSFGDLTRFMRNRKEV